MVSSEVVMVTQDDEQQQEDEGEREQIQLHAVDPGTSINIITPPPMDQCQTDDEKAARQIFETFPPGLQRALESGSLDKVNEVLGKMSVDEAEQVVEQLGNGGMLSLEEGVIDATTEQGKKQVEEIERTRKMPGQAVTGEVEADEDSDDEDPDQTTYTAASHFDLSSSTIQADTTADSAAEVAAQVSRSAQAVPENQEQIEHSLDVGDTAENVHKRDDNSSEDHVASLTDKLASTGLGSHSTRND